jgi:hypothetical protein
MYPFWLLGPSLAQRRRALKKGRLARCPPLRRGSRSDLRRPGRPLSPEPSAMLLPLLRKDIPGRRRRRRRLQYVWRRQSRLEIALDHQVVPTNPAIARGAEGESRSDKADIRARVDFIYWRLRSSARRPAPYSQARRLICRLRRPKRRLDPDGYCDQMAERRSRRGENGGVASRPFERLSPSQCRRDI